LSHRRRIAVLITRAAYGSNLSKGALEATLAASIFDQDLSVVFTEDGVYQLLVGEAAETLGLANYRVQLADLPDYGIDKIYIDSESASQRGISPQDVLSVADWISHTQISEIFNRSDHILSF